MTTKQKDYMMCTENEVKRSIVLDLSIAKKLVYNDKIVPQEDLIIAIRCLTKALKTMETYLQGTE